MICSLTSGAFSGRTGFKRVGKGGLVDFEVEFELSFSLPAVDDFFVDLRVEGVVVEVAEVFEVTEEERALRGVERRGVDML